MMDLRQLTWSDTDSERVLAAIWAEALELDPALIRPDSDFIALGGDSLEVAACVLRIEDTFGVRLAFTDFLGETATLRALAAKLVVLAKDPQ